MSDKPLPSLEELQRKIDTSKPESDEEQKAGPSPIGNAMRYGTELLAGVGVGGFLGYWIDDAAGTSPLFFILFFFLGFAAGVRNILRNAGNM